MEKKNDNKERTDLQRYLELASATQTGWWESDRSQQIFTCSDNIGRLLGMGNDNIISFTDFFNLVRKDYRDLIIQDFSIKRSYYNRSFPIVTNRGEVWLKIVFCYDLTKDGVDGAFGTIQIVPSEEYDKKLSAVGRINHLLKHIDKITHLFSELLINRQEKLIVHDVLKNILNFYNASNAYLFEFSPDKKFQKCTYEVMTDEVPAVESQFQNLSVEDLPWFSNQILSKQSVVVEMLSQLPPEASKDYQLFNSIGLKSIMAIPLIDEDNVWGYIGIDSFDKCRHCSNEDYLWMISMCGLLGICITLNRTKERNERGQLNKYSLLKNMPIGYGHLSLVRSADGNITDYRLLESNEYALNLFGFSHSQIGLYGSELHDADFMEKNLKFLQSIVEGSYYREIDKTFPGNRNIHIIAYSIGKNEVVELFVDTTEKVKASIAARRSDKLFTDIFINIPIGEAIYDTEGRVTDMNNSFMEIFGLTSLNDAKGYFLFDESNLSEEKKLELINNDVFTYTLDYSFDKVDNYRTIRRGTAHLNCKVMKLYDDNGRHFGFLLIVIEDSDRLIASNKIRDFENFFSLISDYAKIGYAKVNLLTNEGYALPQWYKNMGEEVNTPFDEICGQYRHMHPTDKKRLMTFIKDLKVGKNNGFSEELRILKEGTTNQWNWIYKNMLLTKYAPEDGIIEVISVNYDINKFKEVENKLVESREKAIAMDKLKSAFLANMSHEIRTPLNAIIGFSDLLVDTEDKDERNQYIDILHENNELLLRLINDILDLSRLEAGMVELDYSNVDINLLCDDIVRSMRLKVKNNVDIIFDTHEPVCYLYIDSARLTQVITNFINNAIKFTSNGSIKLGYEWIDNGHVRFHVIDTGVGISKERLKNVFDRFVKLDNFVQGTGLGLSICRNIIEQMGGKIGVDSELGKGSNFWFILSADKEKSEVRV